MQRSRTGGHRIGLALAIVVLLSMVGASPAAAGGEHTGTYGVHALSDTEAYPGVTCNYPDPFDNTVRDLRIRAPIVYGVDRTSGTDAQTVGWKYQIFRTSEPNHDTYALAYTSPPMKATATDRYNAQWPGVRYTIANPAEAHKYLVRIKMIWYWPTASQPQGTALHAPIYYRYLINGTPSGSLGECGWTTG